MGGVRGDAAGDGALRIAFPDGDLVHAFIGVVEVDGVPEATGAIGDERDAEVGGGVLACALVVAEELVGDAGDEDFLVNSLHRGDEERDEDERDEDAVEGDPRGEDGDELAPADEVDAGEAHRGDQDDAGEVAEELEQARAPEVERRVEHASEERKGRGILAGDGSAGVHERGEVDDDIDSDDEAHQRHEDGEDVDQVEPGDVAVEEIHGVVV